MKRLDLTNKRFGRLRVLAYVDNAKNGNARWLCHCDCGNETIVDSYRLRNGITTSCGCYRKEVMRQMIRQNAKTAAHIGNVSGLKIQDHVNVGAITRISKKNTSGVIGVSYDSHTKSWNARLVFKKKLVLNRRFATFEEAVQAREAAEARYVKPLLAKLSQQCQTQHSQN